MMKIAEITPAALAEEIIKGRRLKREEDLTALLAMDLTQLCEGADRIRQSLVGDKVDLCTILNGKSGRCSENCKFCAQSGHYQTPCEEYGFMNPEDILENARQNQLARVNRFAVVTSGMHLSDREFQLAIEAYEKMHRELDIGLCASLGFLDEDRLRRLYEAGVRSYHENLETSEANFPNICTTHTYQDKVDMIRRAQKAGFRVCSGGIIGMGESWQDRIDMAVSLAALGIRSIPINVLMAIPGTPLEHQPHLTEDEILRTVAIYRYINPEANIRLAGGRSLLTEYGKKAFCSGVSATITGNMLTTSSSTIQSDREMLTALGRDVTPDYQ